MASEMMLEVLEMIEARAHSRPTPFEFELAYEAHVAIDRLRFAIKHAEQFCPQSDPLREAGLQLLDALERLESVERRFQQRSRAAMSNPNGQRSRVGVGSTAHKGQGNRKEVLA